MTPSSGSTPTWQRLLVGNAPFTFLLEVLMRSLLVYVVMLGVMRLLGKRMSGQVGNLELAVMIALGAIISAPMQLPENGLVPALVLLITLLALQRGVSGLSARSERVQHAAQGDSAILVKNGLLVPESLAKVGISNKQLFSSLRSQGVRHLGELKRVYLESTGTLSVCRMKTPVDGLCVLPDWDVELQRGITRPDGLRACTHCGAVARDSQQRCPNCGHDSFWLAVAARHDEPEQPASAA